MHLKTIEQYEKEIKSINEKIKMVKKAENDHKVSNEVKKRIVDIMKNKSVELTNGELHYILEPLVNRENYIARKEK